MSHGTRTSYVNGCRCEQCRAANRDYARRNSRQRLHESWGAAAPTLVDAEPARQHVHRLRAAGIGRRTIALRAGVSETVVARLLGVNRHRPSRRIRPDVEQRLLAVTDDQHADGAQINALVTHRKLQALVAVGWSMAALSSMSGVKVSAVLNLPRCTVATAKTVADLYDRLHMTAGGSRRAINHAEQRWWAPPLAWDNIDDPDAQPHQWQRAERDRFEFEDLHFMLANGASMEEAARRLGTTVGAIEKRLTRNTIYKDKQSA